MCVAFVFTYVYRLKVNLTDKILNISRKVTNELDKEESANNERHLFLFFYSDTSILFIFSFFIKNDHVALTKEKTINIKVFLTVIIF